MAIQNFKNIVNNKAYLISSKDRQIFEQGDYTSFFGFGSSDAIEFIVYDANDNQLEQASFGKVRYIPLTNENINDYILLPDGTLFQALNFPKEYFIDVERLLREAGYDNGIFKTQVSLLNTRVGDFRKDNKLWIAEISPSRTEVRLLPIKKPTNQQYQLDERFKLFISAEEFRDDTIQYALGFLEKINPLVIDTFLKSKYSDAWVERMNNEYRVGDIDAFSAKVYNKFLQSAIYEFTNRYSDINSILYGNPKPNKPDLKLSKNDIKQICTNLLIRAIDFYLTKPDTRNQTEFQIATEQSLDIVSDVLQTKTSDTTKSTIPPVVQKAEVVSINQRNEVLELDRQIRNEVIIIDTDSPPDIKAPIETVEFGGYSGGGGGGGTVRTSTVNYTNPATGEIVVEEFIRENIK